MSKELTLKQTNFVIEYISNGGNKVRAALKVYDTTGYKTASKIADSNFKNPIINDKIYELLSDNDISADTIAEKIKQGLEAQMIIYNKYDKTTKEIIWPDHNTQHKYLGILIDLLGLKNGGR